jgi:hypothetical protein
MKKGNDRERQRHRIENSLIRRVDQRPRRRYVLLRPPVVPDRFKAAIVDILAAKGRVDTIAALSGMQT